VFEIAIFVTGYKVATERQEIVRKKAFRGVFADSPDSAHNLHL
jgi:hypothetical protein